MKVAMYLRKSREDLRDEALGEGETLTRHRRILTTLIANQGLTLVKTFEEIVSGESISDRKQMQLLLQDVYAKKYDGVVVMDVDRLGRGNAIDQGTITQAFKYSKTLIITRDRTYDATKPADEQYLEFGQFMAKKEGDMIKNRMQGGHMDAVRAGNYLSPHPPYGYDIVKLDKRTRTLKPNDNAKYVKMMFDWVVNDNLSCKEIARRLTSMGIPTQKNKPEWNKGTIFDIVQNHIYLGKIRWKKTQTTKEFINGELQRVKRDNKIDDFLLFEGKHPAIIEQDVFDKVKSKFKGTAPTKSRGLQNVFAGILKCSKCDRTMTYQTHRTRSDNVQPRLLHATAFKCNSKSIVASKVLEMVIVALKEKIEEFNTSITNTLNGGEVEAYHELKNSMNKELEKLKRRKDGLFEKYEDGDYTREEFTERKQIYITKINNLKEEISNLKEPKVQDYKDKIVSFNEVINSLKNPDIPVSKSNILLKSIIEKIEYTNDNEVKLHIHFK